MRIDLDRINNLYKERYAVTLDIIEHIHKVIDSGEYRQIIDTGQKLAPHILNEEIRKIN